MKAKILFVHALSPLHPGTGQGVGVIDLPIAREKATGLPYLPGSSLKGPLREAYTEAYNGPLKTKIFGPETTAEEDFAGSAQFGDQRLLLLPVRSLAGTFAWVTSPFVLRRLGRDAAEMQLSPALPNQALNVAFGDGWIVPSESRLKLSIGQGNQRPPKVVLEDLDLTPQDNSAAKEWADWLGKKIFPNDTVWQALLRERFCIVHDDVLSFLLSTATEVVARVKLEDDTKTVQKGGLWYEEALPAETVLAGPVVATPVGKWQDADPAQTILNEIGKVATQTVQLGGKATVGRGLCRLRMG